MKGVIVESLKNVTLEDLSKEYMTAYGKYVVEDRALPDYHDGLKPVHRMILWSMKGLKLHHTGGVKKSARTVGECFVAGTKVETPYGLSNIETIKVGDIVCTTKGNAKVSELYWTVPQETRIVELKDGSSNTCTKDQKFKIFEQGNTIWRSAAALKPDDKVLVSHNGDFIMVGVNHIKPGPVIETFDIQVEEYHEFIANSMVVHNCIGKYHPHGDDSTYKALAKMVLLPEPLIHGDGNFGDHTDDPAAQRYTECKLSKYADTYLLDPDYLAVVPTTTNYDGDYDNVPVYLPAKVPNLIVNGGAGIAVGTTCKIPSYSLDSVKSLITKVLQGEPCTPDLCYNTLEFKFPWGGIDQTDADDLKEFYRTGRGPSVVMPEWEEATEHVVEINSLCPGFKIASKLHALSKIDGVRAIEDRTEGGQIKFRVHIKMSLTPEDNRWVINEIRKVITVKTHYQFNITIRRNDGETVDFKEVNMISFINAWIKWRISLEGRVVERLIKLEEEKLQKQIWLRFAFKHRHKIMDSLDYADSIKYLMEKLKMTAPQADYSLGINWRGVSNKKIGRVEDEINKYKEKISVYRTDMKDLPGRIVNNL
jgi:DNA gyrase/topoisomerase IV subunit A